MASPGGLTECPNPKKLSSAEDKPLARVRRQVREGVCGAVREGIDPVNPCFDWLVLVRIYLRLVGEVVTQPMSDKGGAGRGRASRSGWAYLRHRGGQSVSKKTLLCYLDMTGPGPAIITRS